MVIFSKKKSNINDFSYSLSQKSYGKQIETKKIDQNQKKRLRTKINGQVKKVKISNEA